MQSSIAVPARRRRRLAWWIVGGVLLLVIAAAVWVGVRGWLAKGELEAIEPAARSLQDAVLNGDAEAASSASDSLREHAAGAVALTGDPVWRAAELLPWAGGNLRAVRVIASELDRLGTDALPPVVSLASSVAPSLRPVEGRIDLAPLVEARPELRDALTALDTASDALAELPDDGLIEPLAEARTRVAETVGTAADALDALSRLAEVLPAALGADGPRNALVLFQNNAELRSAGGIPGAIALVHADGGAVTLVDQASTDAFPVLDAPALPLPESTAALYGDQVGRFVQDVTMTPDFDLTARLAAEMWQRLHGDRIDTVIAVDPVAIAALLGATGPVSLPDGEQLSADNAVAALLVDVYARYPDAAAQDAFYAQVTAATMRAVMSGSGDPRALVAAFAQAGAEGRISIWSASPKEQAELAGTTLAGASAALAAAGPDAVAVYLNDATGGKMGPYLDVAIDAGSAVCRPDRRPEVEVQVTLTSRAPADAGDTLPFRVTGGGIFGTLAGNITTDVAVYGPTGSFLEGVELDGTLVPARTGDDAGRPVAVTRDLLAPGESERLVFRFVAGEPGQMSPAVLHTPLLQEIEVGALTVECG